jgi:integrase
MQFIKDFHFYLSTVLRLKTISLNDYLILLRKMGRLAVKQRTLKRDPFAGYRLEIPPVNHRYLTGEQLEKIMNADLRTYRLCHTRDLFVFAVFTGLGRAELAELTTDHIITEKDGSKWIYINRLKTKAECRIKLLDIPLQIMKKYKGEGKENKIFYVPATCSLCRSLKMIEEICKLDFHLTFYTARHTFATETCLSNGVPIETISKMMGHSNIRTTQIYAEITNQKVGRYFGILSKKTKDSYAILDDKMPSRVYQCGRYSKWKDEATPE